MTDVKVMSVTFLLNVLEIVIDSVMDPTFHMTISHNDPSCLGPHRVTQVNDNDTVKLVKVAENNDRAIHETWIIWNVHQHRT